jgi:hypothetical protein
MDNKDVALLGMFAYSIFSNYCTGVMSRENTRLKEKLKTYQDDVRYMCDILNKNEIELDEFDQIALNNVEVRVKNMD